MKKIIIFCPSNQVSGGPELLHQLCFWLRKLGYNAYMFYVGYNNLKYNSPVAQVYTCYNVPYLLKYIDNVDNICIVPEVFSGLFHHIKKGTKVFWWLSVDNYYFSNFYGTYDIWSDNNIIHLVQSYYAYDHCRKNGISEDKIYYLSDYLNETYLESAKNEKQYEKCNYVLYNPKKGFKFTNLLMKKSQNTKWLPLINLSRIEMSELMKSSKVYIDFGNHPGKDRIPREAAINGCCIITGKKGSAKFKKDVNIPDEFKFEDSFNNIDHIINKINYIFKNYTTEREKFLIYKNDILAEEENFIYNIINVFKKLTNR